MVGNQKYKLSKHVHVLHQTKGHNSTIVKQYMYFALGLYRQTQRFEFGVTNLCNSMFSKMGYLWWRASIDVSEPLPKCHSKVI